MKRFFSLLVITASLLLLATSSSFAGGVGLGVTRLVYPSEARQVSLSVRNTNENMAFLIQPWAEDSHGNKTSDFIITPPLSVLKPKSEKMLRVIYAGPVLPTDKESVFWLTVKAVPPLNEDKSGNVLQLASANRIKVFYRPQTLTTRVQDAPAMLSVNKNVREIELTNPSPYFLTLVNLSVNGRHLNPLMVPPKDSVKIKNDSASSGEITFQTINDYGAQTKAITLHF
ncbi:fimbria/pilus periplasmic chaperone [Citrobacter amalonaticus]|uniref:fimbria/pilus periplasmic chaperone n=1 Tax=Citrobacter TaxID=544 RepID=UPI0005C51891|nr:MULTISPECIES: fimbria/pilus periplasmic chaperone [Citrobacter]EKW5093970.1 fimbria/pilus periplasmic chaperone [Citrobacter amalonaticus]MBE0397447.1 fimbria/pilus periplasmic chaperone [Citrobacter amalonaticus]MBJ8736876.1 fimbria/pilus periplasmic chaperone [Citrobacter amalonaticus]MBJ9074224.1 fimbria/pilus periplasmic chaperone [Citrobacter amalonaticus]MBJ9079532.1 fimbria/pilus periplasmic chaperone [Citrobacter amalonaticus]